MSRINLNPQQRLVFGVFLKELGELLCENKMHDMRSGVAIEQSTNEATRVRVECSFYITPEARALLEQLNQQYRELIL